MASYNRVILVGNLTRDIELKYTPGGTAVMDNCVAVNDRRKSASGEWIDETTFVDVTFWGRTAEVASEYLAKGSPILVEGRLKLDTWEKEGKKNSKLRVICERMQMLSGGTGSNPNSSGARRSSPGEDPSAKENDYDHEPPRPDQQRGNQPAGQRMAQPTGDGPGYDEPDIPF